MIGGCLGVYVLVLGIDSMLLCIDLCMWVNGDCLCVGVCVWV